MFMFNSPQNKINKSPKNILTKLKNRVERSIDNLIKKLIKVYSMVWKTIEILSNHIIRSQNNLANYRHGRLNIRTDLSNQLGEKHKDFYFLSFVYWTLIILKKSQHIWTKVRSEIITISWLLDITFINTDNVFLDSSYFLDIWIMQHLWSYIREILLNRTAVEFVKINHAILVIYNYLSERISNRKSKSLIDLKKELQIFQNIFILKSRIILIINIIKNRVELLLEIFDKVLHLLEF